MVVALRALLVTGTAGLALAASTLALRLDRETRRRSTNGVMFNESNAGKSNAGG